MSESALKTRTKEETVPMETGGYNHEGINAKQGYGIAGYGRRYDPNDENP
jgi:hypothetical protein